MPIPKKQTTPREFFDYELPDLMWQALDPEGYARTQMNLLRMMHPERVKSDSKPGYSGIEERVMEKSPGLLDAIVQRTDDSRKHIERGPLTGVELDKIILDFLQKQSQQIVNYKSDI
jgi:hypothetical protein